MLRKTHWDPIIKLTIETEYFSENKIARQRFYTSDWELHREDGPAVISYYDNKTFRKLEYYKCGNYHRENGPALIYYFENGNVRSEYYYINGKIFREDGPAVIHYGEKIEKYYYRNGIRVTDELQILMLEALYP